MAKQKKEVNNLIYTLRGTQVMLDSDLAELFEVETKAFNQAVKRNIDRFPDSFRFQLSKEEYDLLKIQIASSGDAYSSFKNGANDMLNIRSQNVTLNKTTNEDKNDNNDKDVLRSQNVTLKPAQGKHRKYLPYVFTEQGVAMLTGLLKSDIAVQMSIRIIIAFVEMRKIISTNNSLYNRIETIESRMFAYKDDTDKKFEQLFNAMQDKEDKEDEKENIFFAGQTYDAYSFIIQLIKKANTEIILIDNYVDNTVLDMISKKKKGVSVGIYTLQSTVLTNNDITKFNKQYPRLSLKFTSKMHDRFLIIDKSELYHIGASIKDLGNKCFAFSKIEDENILKNLMNRL